MTDKIEIIGPTAWEGPVRRTTVRMVCDDCRYLTGKVYTGGHMLVLTCSYRGREIAKKNLLSPRLTGRPPVNTPNWCPYLGSSGGID